jgi:hypothetical protein
MSGQFYCDGNFLANHHTRDCLDHTARINLMMHGCSVVVAGLYTDLNGDPVVVPDRSISSGWSACIALPVS